MLRRLLTIALAAFFIVPSASFAASATQNGYDDVEVKAETNKGSDTEPAPAKESDNSTPTAQAAPATAAGSNLPFTGLEAGLIAAAGLGLAGTGLALRRAGRAQQ